MGIIFSRGTEVWPIIEGFTKSQYTNIHGGIECSRLGSSSNKYCARGEGLLISLSIEKGIIKN